MVRDYCVYDVFTDAVLSGNPLAIVLDSDGLDSETMQAIAREFNLSETVFVAPAVHAAHSGALRIFTPAQELPFAGHPTVGTAVCLAERRFGEDCQRQEAVIVLEEKIGNVRCGVKLSNRSGFAEFDIPKLPEQISAELPKGELADAIGLDAAELTFENHRPARWSAGLPFNFVPVSGLAALARAVSPPAGLDVFGELGVFVYTRETVGHDHHFSARMFAPDSGTIEDPATGSAAAAFAGVIRQFDDLPDGTHELLIEQGYDMGRPSIIRTECLVDGGTLSGVRIGGHAVKIAEGKLRV